MVMVNPSATLSQLVAESGWLRRLALALVKDEAAADDLVHDTYLVAATQLPTDGRPVRPWLARVLWNRVRMRSRSGQRRRAREQAFGELAASPARPDDIVDHLKLQRLLAGLVLELAPAQRDVLLLHYFEGLTSSQIGARLDIPPGTVRWRLKQAIDELRTRLEERSPNRAWVPALAGFGRGAKTALVPKLLVIAFVAIAIFAVVLHSEVRAVATGAPSHAVAHEKRRPALPAEDDPSSPTAARAAASLGGIEQVFGAEQRRVEG
jgi:RNA polymerase sigma-70 factor (ECF subfamily)